MISYDGHASFSWTGVSSQIEMEYNKFCLKNQVRIHIYIYVPI